MNARAAKVVIAYLTGRLDSTDAFLALGWEAAWPTPSQEVIVANLSNIVDVAAETGEHGAREALRFRPGYTADGKRLEVAG